MSNMDYANSHRRNKVGRFKKPRYVVAGLVLVVLVGIAVYFGIRRPQIVPVPGGPGVRIANEGRMDARIFRVDMFWYWGSEVGFITDIPPVTQHVKPTGNAERLDIPKIPAPDRMLGSGRSHFMKIAIRYQIPGIPIFRYRTIAYFRYDREKRRWLLIDTIPTRYRSLGNLGRGDVKMIELSRDGSAVGGDVRRN